MQLEDRLREEILKRKKAKFDKDSVNSLVEQLESRINYLIEENERLNTKL